MEQFVVTRLQRRQPCWRDSSRGPFADAGTLSFHGPRAVSAPGYIGLSSRELGMVRSHCDVVSPDRPVGITR